MFSERYSLFSLLRESLRGHTGWKPAWRKASPQTAYDIVIVGGGGHGLATAYYLAKRYGVRRVAVLEKGWIGNGNIGRNTTIVRSNYLLPENAPFYECSMKLWEGLEQDINYNAMVSQRGVLNLFHNDAQRNAYIRRGNAMRLHGIDAELLDVSAVRAKIPFLNFDDARFPVQGGLLQRRGGTVRHDAVAWGYARAADQLGVDIIENCEVTGITMTNGRVVGVQTSRGPITASKVGLACAGNSSRVAAMAGLRLPIESHVLQAFVSEGLKPFIDCVTTFGAGHFYISQSDKGGLVFGGDLDGYNSYAQRGNMPVVEDVVEGGMALMPRIGRVRLLRQWGGLMDMSMDGSPIIDRTPVDQLYLNAGWCYGGFKATPASGLCFAHLLARDEPHEVATAYRLDRFGRGAVIDEKVWAHSPICIEGPVMRLNCPHCGERGLEEFTYRGDATLRRPAADAPAESWIDYVYLRDNPAGCHEEYCYHGAGCRAWLVVDRDTTTHTVHSVRPAGSTSENARLNHEHE